MLAEAIKNVRSCDQLKSAERKSCHIGHLNRIPQIKSAALKALVPEATSYDPRLMKSVDMLFDNGVKFHIEYLLKTK